ncbi:IS21 family transposase ISCth9 [subsurface metagenome]
MAQELVIGSYLKQLRLPAMAQNYNKLAREAAEANMPYEDYLLALLELETAHRVENATKKRISRARFPYLRTLDQFDFSAVASLSKARVLDLTQGEYIRARENVIAIGNTGTGKTHLAISLGLLACQQGWKVRFYTAAGLINELSEAQAQQRLSRLQKQLQSQQLVILDEVGFIPFFPSGSQALFEFCSSRYLTGSLIITTNLEFERWTEVFGDERLTAALLDRLTHKCHILEMNGESYRFKESMRRREVIA